MNYLKNNPIVFAAIIFSLGMIISFTIYLFANRYEVTNGVIVTDTWTGTFEVAKERK